MSQLTDNELIIEATVIQTETALGANTADRVGTMFIDSINSKINIDVIDPNTSLGTSDAVIPTQNAVKTYADLLVAGLLRDQGNYNASSNLFPSTGGSGAGGAVMKGDLWYINVAGTLGGVSVLVGYSVRALINTPGQTSTNWAILNVGLGFVPENVTNKSTNVALGASDTLYPSQNAVRLYVNANAVGKNGNNTITGDNNFTGNNQFQGEVNTEGTLYVNNILNIGLDVPIFLDGDAGTSGKVLTSQGGAATPTWETPTPGISPADNTVFTGDITFNQNTEFTAGITTPIAGTSVFNGTLDVNYLLRANGSAGTAGQVLTSRGGSQSPIWGDGGGLPYKVYTVLLNQTFAGGFTNFVLQDTVTSVGTTLSWDDVGNGIYNLISTGSSPFTINKTWIVIGQVGNFVSYLTSLTPNNVYIKTPNGQYFQNLSIEIRVYP